MGILLSLLGGLLALAAFAASIFILIDAFKNEIWKGVVGLLCGLYLLYYAIVEFQHDKKWLIIAVAIGGSLLGQGLIMAGAAMSAGGLPTGG